MLQAAFLDCQFLDLVPFLEDGFSPAEVDIGGCDVVKASVVAALEARSFLTDWWSDRVRSSVRPHCAAFSEAAGRYGDQRIGSKSLR